MAANTNTPALLPPEEATGALQDLYARALFQKLAGYGIAPENAKEAEDLLLLAGQLREVDESSAFKQAGESRYSGMLSDLSSALTQYGLPDPVKTAAEQQQSLALYELAGQLAQDSTVHNSVLSYKLAQAQELLSQA